MDIKVFWKYFFQVLNYWQHCRRCIDEEVGKLSPKKFDKFMVEFNKGLLNQSIEHNRDGRLEVDSVKKQQISLEPQSYLSNASVQGHLTQNKVKLIS